MPDTCDPSLGSWVRRGTSRAGFEVLRWPPMGQSAAFGSEWYDRARSRQRIGARSDHQNPGNSMLTVARTLLRTRVSATAICLLTGTASAQVQTEFYRELWPMVLSEDGSVIAGIDYAGSGPGSAGYVAVWDRFGPATRIARQDSSFPPALDYEGEPLSLSESGDRLLYTVPFLPAWAATWTQSSGSVNLPSGPSTSFALRTSGDGTQTFGFTTGHDLLRWSGTNAPQVLCGGACGISPTGVTESGDAVVGSLAGSLRYWSAATGTVIMQGGFPSGGGQGIDISSDGSTVVGLTQAGELFSWSPSAGHTVIGIPPWADRLEQVFVNGTGDRVFSNARMTSATGQSIRAACMWEPGTGWRDFRRYLTSRGATGYSSLVHPITFRDVSADGTAAIVDYRLHSNPWSRAVIYFADEAPGTIGTNYCGPMPGLSWQFPATLVATGSDVLAANDVALRATHLPPNQAAIALSSRSAGLLPSPGGALGSLCLGSPIGRHNRPHEVQFTGPNGSFEMTLDLTDIPHGGGVIHVLAGDTWHFQVWSRIWANTGYTSVMTDAVAITFQ